MHIIFVLIAEWQIGNPGSELSFSRLSFHWQGPILLGGILADSGQARLGDWGSFVFVLSVGGLVSLRITPTL
jgi:hypothetical protein